ncbi:hypothetical protein AM499_04610 [Bacillus sp. FJAT-22090]|uniref:hypothetical protein n=1 Tax=Bacillus sp. FJAT-22090 TaxID=1581038 RepID=UPI0006B003C2|nr:hypothetical protein [Bacillus sp. FJAT-22090]ALC85177.1 hypothetical protein AM499_04610 [Bacillus sp. FJAT-22090]
MKYKTVLFCLLVFVLLFILVMLLPFLQEPDVYQNYEEGVTIEINNLSGSDLANLNFSYGYVEDTVTVYKEIGNIERLKPGNTSIIKTKKNKNLNNRGRDTSIYMNYKLLNGFEINENLVYFNPPQPDKIVLIININQIDSYGNIDYDIRGFDGVRSFPSY